VLHERRADAAAADGLDGVELPAAAAENVRGDSADDACVVGGGGK
jgi:hypothetical protein